MRYGDTGIYHRFSTIKQRPRVHGVRRTIHASGECLKSSTIPYWLLIAIPWVIVMLFMKAWDLYTMAVLLLPVFGASGCRAIPELARQPP